MQLHRICRYRLAVAFLTLSALASMATDLLDRGVVAFPAKNGGVYVGWRLLGSDAPDAGFDIYRSDAGATPQKLNTEPITNSTNYVDRSAGGANKSYVYSVAPAGKGIAPAAEAGTSVAERVEIGGMRRIKLPDNMKVQRVGVADLDGDGKLDYLLKHPDFNADPYVLGEGYWKPSPEPYKLDAYRHDGTFLWRYDMGPGIETGIWYSPTVVYDVDADGKAEIYCKAGPTDPSEIVRHEKGMVMGGPEFLVKLDGATGRELARIPWPNRDGFEHRGLTDHPELLQYNYASRNLLGVAYLDGKRPHLIVERGTYTLIKIQAYDPNLKLVWNVETTGDYEKYSGQGTHGMQIGDVDDDGRDEVIIGSAAIDDDGKLLWNTGRGHPDVCYLGKIDPALPGQQVFYGLETRQQRDGLCLVDARTGKTLWGYAGPTIHIHNNGMVADIDPTRSGMECYGGEANATQFFLYDARGNRIGDKPMGGLNPRAVWWDDSVTKRVIAGGKLFQFKPPTEAEATAIREAEKRVIATPVVKFSGPAKVSTNELWPGYLGDVLGKVEGNLVTIVDCLGDWREEVIVSVPGEMRIYSTTIPATSRRVTLMQDRQYGLAVARQLMGYFYPPIVSGK